MPRRSRRPVDPQEYVRLADEILQGAQKYVNTSTLPDRELGEFCIMFGGEGNGGHRDSHLYFCDYHPPEGREHRVMALLLMSEILSAPNLMANQKGRIISEFLRKSYKGKRSRIVGIEERTV